MTKEPELVLLPDMDVFAQEDRTDDLDMHVCTAQITRALPEILPDPMERDVYERRVQEETLESVAKAYGCSRESIRKLEAKAYGRVLVWTRKRSPLEDARINLEYWQQCMRRHTEETGRGEHYSVATVVHAAQTELPNRATSKSWGFHARRGVRIEFAVATMRLWCAERNYELMRKK